MPTQQEIEFYRKKYQKLTPYKVKVAWFISLVSNVACAPLELLKVRGQLLQEGRKLHGYGTERGAPTMRMFTEIVESGHGIKSMFAGVDSLIMRSFWYGFWRADMYAMWYGFFNPDPRRQPMWSTWSFAGFAAGFSAGFITNPIDIVYNRQAADALYPKQAQRSYSNFLDGLLKCNHERVLFRGAVASGMAYGALNGSMSAIYDYLKEYMYYFFGPPKWLRPLVLIPTAAIGAAAFLPFDNIKVRLHTMRALPNGQLPYLGFRDALAKALNYEGHNVNYSSPLCLLTGFVPTYIKIYFTLLVGIYISDWAFQNNYKEGELWQMHTSNMVPRPINIPHDPYNNVHFNNRSYNDKGLEITARIPYDKKNPNTYISV